MDGQKNGISDSFAERISSDIQASERELYSFKITLNDKVNELRTSVLEIRNSLMNLEIGRSERYEPLRARLEKLEEFCNEFRGFKFKIIILVFGLQFVLSVVSFLLGRMFS